VNVNQEIMTVFNVPWLQPVLWHCWFSDCQEGQSAHDDPCLLSTNSG